MKNWLIGKLGGVSASKYVGDVTKIAGVSNEVVEKLNLKITKLEAEKPKWQKPVKK